MVPKIAHAADSDKLRRWERSKKNETQPKTGASNDEEEDEEQELHQELQRRRQQQRQQQPEDGFLFIHAVLFRTGLDCQYWM